MFGRATIRLGIGPHSSYSYCDFIRTLHNHYWFVQVQVLVFYAVLFLEKFNRTQSVPI